MRHAVEAVPVKVASGVIHPGERVIVHSDGYHEGINWGNTKVTGEPTPTRLG